MGPRHANGKFGLRPQARGTRLYDWNRPTTEVLSGLHPARHEREAREPARSPQSAPVASLDEDVSLTAQIDCVRREVSMREKSYPHQIAQGRLAPPAAAKQIARMRAVLDTLVALQRVTG